MIEVVISILKGCISIKRSHDFQPDGAFIGSTYFSAMPHESEALLRWSKVTMFRANAGGQVAEFRLRCFPVTRRISWCKRNAKLTESSCMLQEACYTVSNLLEPDGSCKSLRWVDQWTPH